MALDVNLYNAIRQESLYDKKKQNAAENMMLQEKMLQRQQKKEAEQLHMQESREIFLDQIQQTINQFLPEDADRIKQVEMQQRQSVYNAVKDAGGDMKRFYMMGGHKVLRDYKNSIMNSEQVTKGLKNRSQMQQISKDFSEGKIFHDVTVDVTTESGEKEKRQVSVNEALDLFRNGYIDHIPYNGSEKPVDVDFTKFAKNYASRSPYKATRVTKQDLIYALQLEGQSPDIARRVAEQYVVGQSNGEDVTAGFWGLKDFDYTSVNRMWGLGGRGGSSGGGGGKVNSRWAKTHQKVAPIIQSIPHLAKQHKYMSGRAMWRNSETGELEEKFMNSYQADESIYRGLLKSLDIAVDGNGRVNDEAFDVPMLMNLTNGQGYQGLQRHHYKLNNISKNLIVVADSDDPTKNQLMMEAEILIDEETMEDVLDWEDLGWRTEAGKQAGMGWKDADGNEVVHDLSSEEEAQLGLQGDWRKMKVAIPLPMDDVGVANMNKNIGYVQGEAMGEANWQDWVNNQYYSSAGTAPVNYQGDINYGNIPQGNWQDNPNDVARQKAYQQAMAQAMKDNPAIAQYQQQINALQQQIQQQGQAVPNTTTANQNTPTNLNPFGNVDIPTMTQEFGKNGISPQELLVILNQLKTQ